MSSTRQALPSKKTLILTTLTAAAIEFKDANGPEIAKVPENPKP